MNESQYRVDECIFMLDCARKYLSPAWKNNPKFPEPRLKGAGICLWTDTPSAMSEDEILEGIRPYFTAIAKKARGIRE
jgi:hypothetical protein